MSTFTVLIVTKSRPGPLGSTLQSIAACDPGPLEVIVVDGDERGSAGPVVEQAASTGLPARHLLSPPSLSVQRNTGVEVARGEIVVFLDDDVELDEGLFAALERPYGDPSVVGATGRVIEPEGRRFGGKRSGLRRLLFPGGRQGTMTGFGYPRRILDPDEPGDIEWMQGCFMSARTEIARGVPHDELISARYEGEDEDFSYRLSRLGRLRYEPGAVIEHLQLGFGASTARQREFNRDIVLVRTYLFRKNFTRSPLNRVRFALLVAMLFGHRLLNREWAGARGVLDGAARAVRTRGLQGLLETPAISE